MTRRKLYTIAYPNGIVTGRRPYRMSKKFYPEGTKIMTTNEPNLTHYRRTCEHCGNTWDSLHCAHDGIQRPCPKCEKISTKLIGQDCTCEADVDGFADPKYLDLPTDTEALDAVKGKASIFDIPLADDKPANGPAANSTAFDDCSPEEVFGNALDRIEGDVVETTGWVASPEVEAEVFRRMDEAGEKSMLSEVPGYTHREPSPVVQGGQGRESITEDDIRRVPMIGMLVVIGAFFAGLLCAWALAQMVGGGH